MRRLSIFAAVVSVCCLAAGVWACDPGAKATSDKVAAGHGQCPFASASSCMKGDDFPAMVALVGDEKFECCDKAAAYAKDHKGQVKYVVSGETFECRDKALAALACASECYVGRFTSISAEIDGKWVYSSESCGKGSCCSGDKASVKTASASGHACCSGDKSGAKTVAAGAHEGCSGDKSSVKTASAGAHEGCSGKSEVKTASAGGGCPFAAAKAAMASETCHKEGTTVAAADFAKAKRFRVAGHIYNDLAEAKKAQQRARDAVSTVKLVYRVEGKDVTSEENVCPIAKKAGKVVYVIGKETTPCEMTAKVMLSKAQVDAAKKSVDLTARA